MSEEKMIEEEKLPCVQARQLKINCFKNGTNVTLDKTLEPYNLQQPEALNGMIDNNVPSRNELLLLLHLKNEEEDLNSSKFKSNYSLKRTKLPACQQPMKWKGWQFILLLSRLKLHMKYAAVKFKPFLLSKSLFGIIHDKAADFQNIMKQSNRRGSQVFQHRSYLNRLSSTENVRNNEVVRLLQKINYFIVRFFSVSVIPSLPSIHPQSKPAMAWDIFIFILTLANFVMIPFDLAFLPVSQIFHSWLLELTSPILFSIDIIKKCFTGFYSKGELVSEPQLILKTYASSSLIFDLIAIISFWQAEQFLRLLFFVKIIFLDKQLNTWKEHLALNQNTWQMYKEIVQLFLGITYASHILGCAIFFIGRMEQENGQGWLIQNNLQNLSLAEKYSNSFYFAISTISSLKPSIVSRTETEKSFLACVSIFSGVFYAYCISSINVLLGAFNQQKKRYEQKMSILNKYLRENGVKGHLQSMARNYIYYQEFQSQEFQKNSDGGLQCLSVPLRNEILTSEFLRSLCLKLNSNVYVHREVILDASKPQLDPQIYIISSGISEMFFSAQSKSDSPEVRTIKEKSIFGHEMFFGHGTWSDKKSYSVRSKGISKILSVKLSDMLDLLNEFPQDKEQFMYIRDSFSLCQNQWRIQTSCHFCNSSTHLALDCRFILPQFGRVFWQAINKESTQLSRDNRFIRNQWRNKYSSLMVLSDFQIDKFRNRTLTSIERDYVIKKNVYSKTLDIEKEEGEEDEEEQTPQILTQPYRDHCQRRLQHEQIQFTDRTKLQDPLGCKWYQNEKENSRSDKKRCTLLKKMSFKRNNPFKNQDSIKINGETERGAEEWKGKNVDTHEKQNYVLDELSEKEEEKGSTEFIEEEELDEIFKHQERKKQFIKGLMKQQQQFHFRMYGITSPEYGYLNCQKSQAFQQIKPSQQIKRKQSNEKIRQSNNIQNLSSSLSENVKNPTWFSQPSQLYDFSKKQGTLTPVQQNLNTYDTQIALVLSQLRGLNKIVHQFVKGLSSPSINFILEADVPSLSRKQLNHLNLHTSFSSQ